MTQEALDFGPRPRVIRDSERLRTIIRRVCDARGVKEVAYLADVSPSYLVQALNGDKSLKVDIIMAARELAPQGLLPELHAAMVGDGYRVTGEKPLTVEQMYAIDVVRRLNGEVAAAALREEFRRG